MSHMRKGYIKAKEDFWFIYFTVSASNLSVKLMEMPSNPSVLKCAGEIFASLFFTLIAMNIILYLFKGFGGHGWDIK